MGSSCQLDRTAGTPDGEACAAVQANIQGNHLATVAAGRAGPQCRTGFLGALSTEQKDAPMREGLRARCDRRRPAIQAG